MPVTTAPAASKPIPGIRESPLLGSMRAVQRDRLAFFARMATCGDIGRFHFGPFTGYFVNSPELIHALLVERDHDFEKGWPQRLAFRPVTGDSILILEGSRHRDERQALAPAFQPRPLAHYADAMAACIEARQRGWHDGATLDLGHEMTSLTMAIVGRALFDADLTNVDDALGTAIMAAMQHVEHAIVQIVPPPIWPPTARNRRTRAALATIRRTVQGMIDQRRADGEDRGDFLSMLLGARDAAGRPLSDEQVRAEAITLFIAGHETTAQALTWAWYLLATHPESYARLRAEADAVLGGSTPTVDHLPQLPYALQVLKEAMRLYPPVTAIARISLRAVDLDGYIIPARQSVLLSPYTLHRRRDLFPDPERFDPDRFTPEREKALPRHAFLPFGAGSRVCIGSHFALMEGQLALATLAQRATFALAGEQNPRPVPTVTLRPDPAITVTVHRRVALPTPPSRPGRLE